MDGPDSKVVSIGAPAALQGQINTKQTNKPQLAKLQQQQKKWFCSWTESPPTNYGKFLRSLSMYATYP